MESLHKELIIKIFILLYRVWRDPENFQSDNIFFVKFYFETTFLLQKISFHKNFLRKIGIDSRVKI